jgi:hypothetical protein
VGAVEHGEATVFTDEFNNVGIEVRPQSAAPDVTSVRGRGVWARALADGSTAVALLNRTDTTTVTATSAEQAGAPESDGHTLGAKTTTTTSGPISTPTPPHSVVLYRVRPRN